MRAGKAPRLAARAEVRAEVLALDGGVVCAWCGCEVPLITFGQHAPQCERAIREGRPVQTGLFQVYQPARSMFAEVGL